ncbi:MAG: hypothetical protein KC431_24195, partial [Myxococcales bacterium]|nr:hypothetical protein [Myxococcales bacterium]
PAPYSGAAYVGVDRVTLQEVEIHLLLAEFGDMDRPGPAIHQALERFAAIAEAAQALAHPAIRPILRLDPRVGLLVMPRREGPILRDLVRAPGMATVAGPRARSLIAFLLDALAAAHGVGLVHGSLLPSQITCDALGRPTLGPFGAYHLAGLVATRTGGLEEILALTPAEQRAGETPQQAGDLYMLGALWAALLAGRFDDPHVLLEELEERGVLPEDEAGEIERWLATDPAARPAAREARRRLDVPVSDLSKLAGAAFDPGESMRTAKALDRRLGRALTVVAADSWSDELLDRLCATRNPWLQNILDRDGRVFQLAAWPAGCRRLEADSDWRAQVHPLAMTLLAPSTEPNAPEALAGRQSGEWDDDSDRTLREAVAARIDGEAIVITAAGERMLALDRLLLR